MLRNSICGRNCEPTTCSTSSQRDKAAGIHRFWKEMAVQWVESELTCDQKITAIKNARVSWRKIIDSARAMELRGPDVKSRRKMAKSAAVHHSAPCSRVAVSSRIISFCAERPSAYTFDSAATMQALPTSAKHGLTERSKIKRSGSVRSYFNV